MEDVSGFNPKRSLCPDGACTGIIGTDGRCGECGRGVAISGQGGSPEMRESKGEEIFALLDAADAANPAEFAVAHSPDAAGADGTTGFDPNRRLCEDGTCVGFIGATGVCTVCGRVGR